MSQPDSTQNVVPDEESPTDDTSKLELFSLPERAIEAIVSRIPLQLLISTLPLVHPRLSTFRETALRNNRHLELFIGNQEGIQSDIRSFPLNLPFSCYLVDSHTGQLLYPETDFYRLCLPTLESLAVDELTSLMPGITHLTLRLHQVDILIISDVIRLLTSWSSSLASLNLSCVFQKWREPNWETERDKKVIRYMRLRIIKAINKRLTNLKHLTLHFKDPIFGRFPRGLVRVREAPIMRIPLLRRLREFNFASDDQLLNIFINNLRFDKKLKSLQAISIGVKGSWNVFLDTFSATSSQLASRFVHLPNISARNDLSRAVRLANASSVHAPDTGTTDWRDDLSDEETNLRHLVLGDSTPATVYLQLQERFIRAFPNLKALTVQLDFTRPLSTVLGVVSSLRQLQCLKLKITDSIPLYNYRPGNFWQTYSESDSKVPLPEPLPSVTVLYLDFYSDIPQHTDLVYPLWAHLFPSLQILIFEHKNTRADFCDICYRKHEQEFMNQILNQIELVAPCVKQLFAPFSLLPCLRKIFYKLNYLTLTTTAEFTPAGDFVQVHTEAPY